ncbi:MAG: alpha/beta hydrolase, partial [Actinomycetota bacterium]|nr:alpha/beta hydrolase [Actinomycetota bacterium]
AALGPDYRCVSWDARGHGETETEGSYSFWDQADDLIALMDHLSIDRAVLTGMSQGGYISLRATLKAPERAGGLFLIDSQAGTEPEHLVPGYEMMLERWLTGGPTPELAEAVAAIIISPADHEPWVSKMMKRPAEYPRDPMNCLLNRDDITDRLPEIEAPALVVYGTADPTIPPERFEQLCEGLARCEGLVAVEGGGHAANLSHPERVNELLIDFCKRHAGQ